MLVTELLASYMLITSGVSPSAPIRILPLGDSITQGGMVGRDEFSYRYPLFKLLKENGAVFQFVGSLQTGLNPEFKWPDREGMVFDRHHEGHYGWKTAEVRDQLEGWMKSYSGPADIALIHLGGNDEGSDPQSAVVQPLTDIISLLRKANPRVVVLVGHLNSNGGAARTIRGPVEAMAKALNKKESPVLTVAHNEGWIEDPAAVGSDTFDWAHPNPKGQLKMARAWFKEMKPFLRLKKGRSAHSVVR